MKPPVFEYERIQSIDQALSLLHRERANARILAGGQSLMILLNMRLAQPSYLLDISQCKELNYLKIEDNQVRVGAGVTQTQLQYWPELTTHLPLIAEALPFISHYQIRSRGTVVGSIAHADPSAELALCLATLKGSVVLQSKKGKRELNAAEFQQGILTTAKREDELIVETRLPLAQDGHGYAFDEFAVRRGDFAIVACAVDAGPDHLRLGIGGVADKPVVVECPRAQESEIDIFLNDLAWQLNAQDDQHATASYRRHLVRHLGKNTIKKAILRSQSGSKANA